MLHAVSADPFHKDRNERGGAEQEMCYRVMLSLIFSNVF